MTEKYNIDNAKNDIQNLQDQNRYDFQEIKRLDRLIKEYDEKILQAIKFNNLINKKNQDNQVDYEKIEEIKTQIVLILDKIKHLEEIKTQIVLILDKIKHLEDNTTSGSGGSGLTITQTNQLNEAYTHSQSYHVSKQEIPTKTSQLINDNNYATVNAIPIKTSQLTNNSNYVTESYVETKIHEASLSWISLPECFITITEGV